MRPLLVRKLPTSHSKLAKKTQRGRCCRLVVEELEDRLAPAAGLTSTDAALLQNYGQLPLSFEANQGQTAAQVQFLARGSGGYALFLTAGGGKDTTP